MSRVCRACARSNPPEARFCYFDGVALAGAVAGAPIAVSALPFHTPLVFASGRVCRTFDELVLGCEAEWESALELLRDGRLEAFLAGVGRNDLATYARRAARSADRERALDQLLEKMPGDARAAPRLVVQPIEINLGQLDRSSDRRVVVHLENAGMGLIRGTASIDDGNWLTLGEGSGSPRKVFQFRDDLALPIQILARRIRAGRPLEGHVEVETNAGSATILVRGDAPARPFPDGVFAGALTPRQLAEKAREFPREAAPYFESGAVAAWYQSNGWAYPVQGPASSGVGAVQQFFEALGLAKPPRVEISHRVLAMFGAPGEAVEETIAVRAVEKRPVFAHATSDAPWLKIGRVVLDGRSARVPIRVPMVPVRPGEQLRGTVQVTTNGNQRFPVEVVLTVQGHRAPPDERRPAAPLVAAVLREPARPSPAVRVETPSAAALPVALPADDGDPSGDYLPPTRRFLNALLHLFPLTLLVLSLGLTLLHDLLLPVQAEERPLAAAEPIDPTPLLGIRFQDGSEPDDHGPLPTMRFGLVMRQERDPNHPLRAKRLTFDAYGRTNNTCVRIDGKDVLFGHPEGRWLERTLRLSPDASGRPREGLASVWEAGDARVQITQQVELVAGEASGRMDTCLVRYVLENRDAAPHKVGLRFLLDTFIGANDGVPFTIPGATGLCDTQAEFAPAERVPDFIQAVEHDNLAKPGTIAHVQFRVGRAVESPSRVLLGAWPNDSLRHFGHPRARGALTLWEVPLVPIGELARIARDVGRHEVIQPDSAVTMYWDERVLRPKERREVGFSYGLGAAGTSDAGEGKLLLSVGGRLVRDGVFTLTALVNRPGRDERVTLHAPPQLELLECDREQPVPPVPAGAARPTSPVTWRLRARTEGRFTLEVRSSTGAAQQQPISIRTQGVFD